MAESDKQDRQRDEDLMARGPASRGASNKQAPMNDPSQKDISQKRNQSRRKKGAPDYNKMVRSESSGPTEGTGMANDQQAGVPAGATLPEGAVGSGKPRGGRSSSNSTVSGGSSSAGTVIGRGASRDRGSMTNPDMDMTTNTENELDVNSRPGKKKRKVRGQAE